MQTKTKTLTTHFYVNHQTVSPHKFFVLKVFITFLQTNQKPQKLFTQGIFKHCRQMVWPFFLLQISENIHLWYVWQQGWLAMNKFSLCSADLQWATPNVIQRMILTRTNGLRAVLLPFTHWINKYKKHILWSSLTF